MKKIKRIALFAVAVVAASFWFIGCKSSTATSPTGTVIVTKAVDVAAIDAALQNLVSNAPAAIADAGAISALIHGTNAIK